MLTGSYSMHISNAVPDFNPSENKYVLVPQIKLEENKLPEIDVQGYGPDMIKPIPTIIDVA